MDNPLSKLNLKWWFSVLMTVSFFIFVLSLTVELKVFTNEIVALFSAGTFFVALGSFANLTTQQGMAHLMGVTTKIEKDAFKLSVAGVIFYIVGSLLIVAGIYKLF